MSRRAAVVLAGLMVCSVFAVPVAGAQSQTGVETQQENATESDVDYGEIGAELDELATAEPGASALGGESDDDENGEDDEEAEHEEAAAEGARAGAELAQEQGVEVTQEQTQAAVDAATRAAEQHQNASVEQIQAAAKGSAHGALVQSQSVNVTQIQSGVYGGTAGAVSQSQEANVSQTQAAAYGATHGAVAQHQNVNVTQIQRAALGASAGATNAATQIQRVNVTQIQEAAQGGAYGSLTQVQQVSVTQIQAAAFGAAGGGAENAKDADPKKTQEAAMGAAKGSLTQVQEATVEQVQSAARGACEGALTQVQRVSITQIQRASSGAAQGAISQHQEANVVQIQSAAAGAARGTVRQVQRVEIVQVQEAAVGAAAGAARSAAQNQVVNVEQIQAAAAGAGEGAIVQIQQINIVQIQVIAESAAGGALSQHQTASVTQIQSAARGATEGAISVTQRQEITIEQIQIVTERAAADTAATAAEINVENDVTIYNYARGAAEDPDDGDEDDDDDRLRSLFASVEDETVFLANPNDVAVTVTITSEDGDVETITLSPGESVTEEFDPGTYTLTAESEDGRDVELAGRDELEVSVGSELQSLEASVGDRTLTVENPNDQRVTVFLSQDGDQVTSFEVPGDWEVTRPVDPGEYTLTAETEDGQSVQINGQDEFDFEIEPEPIDLDASVENQSLTVENPSETDVTAAVAPDDGDEQELEVAAGESVTEELEPGNYTLTGEADDEDREVLINGDDEFEFTIEGDENETEDNETDEAVDLDASVEGQNLTVENQNDIDVTVAVANVDGDEDYTCDDFETWELAQAVHNASGGAYGLDADDDDIACEELQEAQEESDGDDETNETVTDAVEDGEIQTFNVEASENVTELFDPGNYTLIGETDDEDREVLVNRESAFEFTIEGEENETDANITDGNVTDANATDDNVTDEAVDLNATVTNQALTVENPSETDVSVTVEDGESTTLLVSGGESVTEELDPGDYTLTGEADQEVLINGNETFEFTIDETDANVTDGNLTDGNVTDGNVTDENVTDGNLTDGNVTGGAVDLNVTVEGQNVTLENRNDTDVTVTAAPEDGENRTIEVAAGETVTEPFDPGNYTLTGEADDEDREVTLNGEERLNITVEEGEDGEPDRQLDSCTVIDEPGEYQLTGDISADGENVDTPDADVDVCLDVRSDDVVIEGNGNAVSGDGEDGTVGIWVYNSTAESWNADLRLENVTVRNVTVENWDDGVVLGQPLDDGPSEVTVERVRAVDNQGTGVDLNGVADATLTDVVANDSQRGVGLWEAESVTAENLTVGSNDGIGLHLAQAVSDVTVTDLQASDNGGQGAIYLSDGTGGVEISDGVVVDNEGDGIGVTDASGEFSDMLVASNGAAGLAVGSADATVENVTVRNNEGLEVDAREGGDLTATDLQVEPSATLEFESEALGLEPIPEAELPPLPEDAESAGSGLEVTGSGFDGDIESVQLTLAVNETDEDGELQLWRHDGTEWTAVVNDTDGGETIEAELTEEGTYAPVVVSEEEEDLESLSTTVEGQNLTVENPNDVPVEVTVDPEDGVAATFTAGPGETIAVLEPGTYTVSAATTDGQSVPVDEESVTIPIEEDTTETETETEADNETETGNESSLLGTGVAEVPVGT